LKKNKEKGSAGNQGLLNKKKSKKRSVGKNSESKARRQGHDRGGGSGAGSGEKAKRSQEERKKKEIRRMPPFTQTGREARKLSRGGGKEREITVKMRN